jgi:hypothetical protein
VIVKLAGLLLVNPPPLNVTVQYSGVPDTTV